MSNITFTNFAATTLNTGINSSVTSLVVSSGTGALFPSLAGAQYFYCTLVDAATGTTREIVKVTARSTDTFTIVRGQESTTSSSYLAGDKVELRLTAAGINTFATTETAQTFVGNQTISGTLTATTIGAFTLGGTVAGGGNQLNNVIIGTTTPLAGAFTTLSATKATAGDVITFTNGGATPKTGFLYSDASFVALTTGAGITGNGLYFNAATNNSGIVFINNATIGTFSSTGLAVTGTLSATGNATIGSGVTTTGMVLGVDTGGSIAVGASSGDAVIRAAVGSGTTNRIIFAQGNTGTQYGMFDASGNLGIGTTSPSAKLDVRDVTQLYTSNYGNFSIINSANSNIVLSMGIDTTLGTNGSAYINAAKYGTAYIPLLLQPNSGNVGIGKTDPNYKLEIGTDSAGKPGVGGLWTVVSDERIKSNIVPANLNRCYEIVKSVPLKHFGFAPGVYTDDQIQDKHNLGWIAQDVQKVFKNAVSVKPFTPAIGDVIEDCLDLNGGQMIAALYGCVQALMAKVEALEAK